MNTNDNPKPSNPPAFPPSHPSLVANGRKGVSELLGMSLRDYFAKGAMESTLCQALADAHRLQRNPDEAVQQVAKGAYAIADAMLKEREKEQ